MARLFSDPQLKGLIQTALERNADIRIAQLGLEQSKAALLSAKLGFLPNISAAPSGQYSYNTEVWSYNLPITASWEVDLFGKLRNSLEQQKLRPDLQRLRPIWYRPISSLQWPIATTRYWRLMPR